MYWRKTRSDTHSYDITDVSASLPEYYKELLIISRDTYIVVRQTGIDKMGTRINETSISRDAGCIDRCRNPVIQPEHRVYFVSIDDTWICLVIRMFAYSEILPEGNDKANTPQHILLYI
jgi:hypothetical protein